MSLQLSSSKPRHLQYAPGGLRQDLKLLELDEQLLQAILDGGVVIKGGRADDAVLCTGSKTYAMKLVETTNSLLLLPGQQELGDHVAGLPSLSPGGDARGVRDVGLQTQLQKNAVAREHPPLVATATASAHIELVEVAGRLDGLHKLLGRRPYSLEDEGASDDDGGDDDGGDDDGGDDGGERMEVDCGGAAGGSGRRPPGCHTTRELLELVQASEAELLAELGRLRALQLGGWWRTVDEGYLGSLLEMLLAFAQEHGWSTQAIPLQGAVDALQRDGYQPALTTHCLQVYGSASSSGSDVDAAASSSGGGGCASHYALDDAAVCLHYARRLLSQQPLWGRGAFLAAWREAVPEGWEPREEMLLGEALLQEPEPHEGHAEPKLRHFPARALPAAPGPRFAALFAAQPRWSSQQLEPYLAGLRVPGQTVDMLLLKYARATQRSPTDPALVFVAR